MTASQIAEKQFAVLEGFLSKFGYDTQLIQAEIFELLIDLIESLPQRNGKFIYEDAIKKQILLFERKVQEIFDTGSYNKAYKQIFPNIVQIEEVQRALNSYITPAETKAIFKTDLTDLRKGFAGKIASSLGSKDALGLNVVNPLKSILYEYSSYGLTVKEAKQRLFDIAITSPKGGILERYAGQVARDSLFQFTGSVDKAIGDYIGAEDANYLGNIIRDTRPQCKRWLTTFNGFIPGNKLKAELKYVKKRPKEFPGYSKYLPKLSVDTFQIIRGGHNCRHRVVMTVGTNPDIRAKIDKLEEGYKEQNEAFEKEQAANLTGRAKELYEKNLRLIKK